MARWFKWFRKEGQVGLVWFVLEGSKSNSVLTPSVSKSVTKVGNGIELLGQLKNCHLLLIVKLCDTFGQELHIFLYFKVIA